MLRYLSEKRWIREELRGEGRVAEISFNYLGLLDQGVGGGGLLEAGKEKSGEAQTRHWERGHLVQVSAWVAGGRLRVSWGYKEGVIDDEEIQQVAQQYVKFLEQLAEESQSEEVAVSTPSDFPLVQMTQEELDEINALLGDITEEF
jgi:non-ribosomal peptide synthase protein (TIGR01720 family)